MVPVAAFEMGNVATTLLILRATQQLQTGGLTVTAAASLAILIYAGHNAFGAVVAALGGHWIDIAGPRIVFATAAALYVLAYVGFAIPGQGWPTLLVAFSLAGSGSGLPRPQSQPSSLRRFPTSSEAVASACSVAFKPPGTSPHPPWSAFCTPRCHRSWGSHMPPGGC